MTASSLTNLLAAARGAEKALADYRREVERDHTARGGKVDPEGVVWLADIDAALTPLRKAIAEAERLGGVAQSAEPRIPNPERVGSTPTTLASPVTPPADCQCGMCQADREIGPAVAANESYTLRDASRPPLVSLGQGAYRRDIDLQA